MCVNHFVMVPAVVNIVANKGKDTYSGFISDLICIKCRTLSYFLQSNEKDLEELWKTRHPGKTVVRSESPKSAFNRWRRRSQGLKLLHRSNSNNNVENVPKNGNQLQIHQQNNEKKQQEDEMSLLKFLAINALDLSAPASDVLLKSRNTNWFQLSGHPDSLAPAGPGTVWKKRSGGSDDTERTVYEELLSDKQVQNIIPKYYREVEYQGENFIELQDLLHGFQDPFVMDIKMGTRTFLESEVKKTTARFDLFQKMIAIDPDAPSTQEKETQAVTKLRYMQFREQQSSTSSHGFRIEAMKCRGSPPVTDLKKVRTDEEVYRTLDMFFAGKEDTRHRIINRLSEMRSIIEQSEYFSKHEVVGSSVFMIYDDNKVGVWLIDFAKTNKLPEGLTVNHRKPWVQGNHEEGLLFGFDQLIDVIKQIDNPKSPDKGNLSKSLTAVTVKS